MRNKFKNDDTVLVYGPGENDGKFYNNIPAIILERDPFYKDYLVKFNDGSEDWIQPEHIQKTLAQKYNKSIKRNFSKKGVKGYEGKLY